MKPKLHFHADNTFWAGSEQMLTCLFASQLLRDNFDISFSYPAHEHLAMLTEFEKGMERWTQIAGIKNLYKTIKCHPIQLSSFSFREHPRLYRVLKRVCFWYDFATLKKQFDHIAPSIVHVHNGGYPGAITCNAAVFAAKLCVGKPKIVYFVNNLPKERGKLQKFLERKIDRDVAIHVDFWLSGSKSVKRAMWAELDIELHKQLVIPNTIHAHPVEDKTIVRQELGVGPSDVLICSVGVFEPRKGHRYLLEAFKGLTANLGGDKRVFLLLVGHGTLEQEIYDAALKTGSLVSCQVEKSMSYINACDIYVQPSVEHEDFPISILQAMSCGKPIVATDVAGIPEQLPSRNFNMLVRPRSVHDLQQKLSWLIDDPQPNWVYSRMYEQGFNNRLRFKMLFSYDVIMQKYKQFYEDLLCL